MYRIENELGSHSKHVNDTIECIFSMLDDTNPRSLCIIYQIMVENIERYEHLERDEYDQMFDILIEVANLRRCGMGQQPLLIGLSLAALLGLYIGQVIVNTVQ
jgi:hypothetical protein